MKILHTSDWHLGKKLQGFSRLEEQREVLEEITQIIEANDIDVVLIAGDLFDAFNPPNEAVDLFYKSLKRMSNDGQRLIVGIAGNHDSPDRIELPNPLAKECGIVLVGYPGSQLEPFKLDSGIELTKALPGFLEFKLPKYDYPLRCILTPYANEHRLKTYLGIEDKGAALQSFLKEHWEDLANEHCDDQGVNVLMTHLFMIKKGGEVIEESDDEKSILHVGGVEELHSNILPPAIQYAALGHIHKYYVIDKPHGHPIIYSSSILQYSLSEANQKKYVINIDAQPGEKVSYEPLELKSGRQLMRMHFDSVEEAEKWLESNQNVYVEFTLKSDAYLSASVSQHLHQLHDGILNIIPIIEQEDQEGENGQLIDLQQDRTSLFKDYFESKKGVPPSEEILDILKEVLS